MSSLYEKWLVSAFTRDGKSIDKTWDAYMPKEQKIYEYILGEKVTKLGGTIAEIAAKYNMTPVEAVAFVDGINEALINPYDVNTLEENTVVELEIDFEKLYKKMVEYKADHLYSLPQWDNIFTEAQRKEMFLDQRNSKTIIKGAKVGRNDPCPCGSGKKYKHCCGKNQ
ncbi:MAG: SEC-C domain-containing protein [Clostridiales bacterium]|nr:SEC-C domain-containing protein [Clostridiales bacterium]